MGEKQILPELHPAQQGLKESQAEHARWHFNLPELHPAQQGLKGKVVRCYRYCRFTSRTTSSTTRIERVTWDYWKNKWPWTSRTTSSTTRIERESCKVLPLLSLHFQNYIQHNKDWKSNMRLLKEQMTLDFQNYIQHNKDWKYSFDWFSWCSNPHFQNYIQHNKDWKCPVISMIL